MEEVGITPEGEEPASAGAAPAGEQAATEPVPLTLDEMVAELAGPAEAAPVIDERPEADAPAPDLAGDEVPEGVMDEVPVVLEEPAETEPEALGSTPIVERLWTRAPFWVVAGAFAVLVGTIVYLMWPLAAGAFTAHPLYRLFVVGGAALVGIDIVTGLAVWLSARSRAREDEKPGLAARLWIRALAWTAGGVALWWIGVALLDLRHAGLIG